MAVVTQAWGHARRTGHGAGGEVLAPCTGVSSTLRSQDLSQEQNPRPWRLGTVLSRSEARIPSRGAKGQSFERSPSCPGPCSSPAGSEAPSCACARLRPRAVTLERAEPLPSGCLSVRDPRLALLCCQTPLMASAGYRTDSCQRPWPGPPLPERPPRTPSCSARSQLRSGCPAAPLPSAPSLFRKEPLPMATGS